MTAKLKDNQPKKNEPLYADSIKSGPSISPHNRIRLYSHKEWEEFIVEYVRSTGKYDSVEHLAGSGDQGIDVLGISADGNWDIYQCKHYKDPLSPSDIFVELGKLCYYTFTKKNKVPKNYYFVAPHGVGTKLSKLIRKDDSNIKNELLKNELIKNWKKHCFKKITKTDETELKGGLKKFVEEFDFSIIKDLTIHDILKTHKNSTHYCRRFGGSLPSRPVSKTPPESHSEKEAVYIKKLLSAYAEYLNEPTFSLKDLEKKVRLKSHLNSARVQFYCAESLHRFSRDYLPNGEFERLQENIFTGIENIILKEYPDGYSKVRDVVQESFKIEIDSHPLKDRLNTQDRGGICHQLANNNRISWANNE